MATKITKRHKKWVLLFLTANDGAVIKTGGEIK